MANISKVKIDNTSYDIKDSFARNIGTYSSNEIAIGTDENGDTIYRKVYSGATLPSNDVITYNVSSLNINHVVNLYGGAIQNGVKYRPFPFSDGNTANNIRCDVENAEIRIRTFSNWTGWTVRVVIEYVKN